MQLLKQSAAANVPLKVYLASDHLSPATGKTLTVTLSKDGGAFAAAAGAVTEIASGWYKLALTTADAGTPGALVVRATAAGCDDAEVVCQVVPDLPGSLTPAAVATALWTDLTAGSDFSTAGSVGALLKAQLGNVDGKTIPAALQIVAALVAGMLSGSQSGVEVFTGIDGATVRATITTDTLGNRTAASYS